MAPKLNKRSHLNWRTEAYWERPDFDPRVAGDASPEEIFMEVGRALSAWELLEELVYGLFQILCVGDAAAARLGEHLFGLTESSAARSKMLLTALSLYFGQEWKNKHLADPFKDFVKAMGHASHRRNEIAHGRAVEVQTMHNGRQKTSGWFLTAPRYSISRNHPFMGRFKYEDDVLGGDSSLYRYRSVELRRFETMFTGLNSIVFDLKRRAAKGEYGYPNAIIDLMEEGKLHSQSKP